MPRPGDAYFLIPFLNAYYLLPPPEGLVDLEVWLRYLLACLLARKRKKENFLWRWEVSEKASGKRQRGDILVQDGVWSCWLGSLQVPYLPTLAVLGCAAGKLR